MHARRGQERRAPRARGRTAMSSSSSPKYATPGVLPFVYSDARWATTARESFATSSTCSQISAVRSQLRTTLYMPLVALPTRYTGSHT